MNKDEKDRFLKWERLSPTEQHMILMYLYRTETTSVEDLENYIETGRFRQYGIKRADLPQWYQSLHHEKLKEVAYAVIGKTVPLPVIVTPMTQDFSGYLPEGA